MATSLITTCEVLLDKDVLDNLQQVMTGVQQYLQKQHLGVPVELEKQEIPACKTDDENADVDIPPQVIYQLTVGNFDTGYRIEVVLCQARETVEEPAETVVAETPQVETPKPKVAPTEVKPAARKPVPGSWLRNGARKTGAKTETALTQSIDIPLLDFEAEAKKTDERLQIVKRAQKVRQETRNYLQVGETPPGDNYEIPPVILTIALESKAQLAFQQTCYGTLIAELAEVLDLYVEGLSLRKQAQTCAPSQLSQLLATLENKKRQVPVFVIPLPQRARVAFREQINTCFQDFTGQVILRFVHAEKAAELNYLLPATAQLLPGAGRIFYRGTTDERNTSLHNLELQYARPLKALEDTTNPALLRMAAFRETIYQQMLQRSAMPSWKFGPRDKKWVFTVETKAIRENAPNPPDYSVDAPSHSPDTPKISVKDRTKLYDAITVYQRLGGEYPQKGLTLAEKIEKLWASRKKAQSRADRAIQQEREAEKQVAQAKNLVSEAEELLRSATIQAEDRIRALERKLQNHGNSNCAMPDRKLEETLQLLHIQVEDLQTKLQETTAQKTDLQKQHDELFEELALALMILAEHDLDSEYATAKASVSLKQPAELPGDDYYAQVANQQLPNSALEIVDLLAAGSGSGVAHYVKLGHAPSLRKGAEWIDNLHSQTLLNAFQQYVKMLACYMYAQEQGFNGGLQQYLNSAHPGVKVPTNHYASGESNTVMQEERLRLQRVFPVTTDLDPSGRKLMTTHLRFPDAAGKSPRLYLHFDMEKNLVYLGYLGEHLEVKSTN